MNRIKTYKLGRKKKVIIDFLQGRITQEQAIRGMGVTRTQFKVMTSAIFRHLVATNKIDIISALKDY